MVNLLASQLVGLDQGIGGTFHGTDMAQSLDESATERCLTHAQARPAGKRPARSLRHAPMQRRAPPERVRQQPFAQSLSSAQQGSQARQQVRRQQPSLTFLGRDICRGTVQTGAECGRFNGGEALRP